MLFLPDNLKFLTKSLIDLNKFYNSFEIWLNSKKNTSFFEKNGYCIFNTFLIENYSKSIDVFDYRVFIKENREIIKIVEVWISFHTLSLEQFNVMFREYFSNNIERFSRNNLEQILVFFYIDCIENNFYFDKSEVDLNELYLIINLERKEYVKIRKLESFDSANLNTESNLLKIQLKEKDLKFKRLKREEEALKLKRLKIEEELYLKIVRKEEALKLKNIKKEEEKYLEVVRKEEALKLKRFKREEELYLKVERKEEALKLKKFKREEELYLKVVRKEEALKLKSIKKEEEKKIKKIKKDELQRLKLDRLNSPEYLLNKKNKKKEERRRYKKARYKRDVTFRIIHRLRTRITNVLNGKKKKLSSMNLLGCSPDFLKVHLESQFTVGMTWDNYGPKGWHIDHIIPCASFDLNKIEEQKKCFHYSNLQPLWWYDNIEKADKITWKKKP